MDIVVSHVRSDYDAVGATVAASKLYPDAYAVVHAELDPEVARFVALYKDALRLKGLDELDLDQIRRVIVVDTAAPDRLRPVTRALDGRPVEWVVFDHHPPTEGDLPTGGGERQPMGAATTLVVRELERRNIQVSPLEATAMALGIYADTGQLTFPSTRPDDARAVAWLLARGADLEVVGRYLSAPLDVEQQALLQSLLASARTQTVQGCEVLVAGAQVPDYLEGVALVVHKLGAVESADVVAVAVEMGKRTQFVARSRLAGIDLRELLVDYNPKGHPQACSGHARELPLDEAIAALWGRFPVVLPPEPVASDLMSAPVRTTGPGARISEVGDRLQRYGHGALVVLDGSRLVGIISRRDIGRATHHGLGDALVGDVMTREVVTAPPDASLTELEGLILTHDIGRVPIVHHGAVVGIVTRSDVLAVRGGRRRGQDRATHPSMSDWRRRLEALWPADWLALLAEVGELVGQCPLYLVGGAVRDLLLERANLDVDLVVEGDAIATARQVAAGLEARHPGLKLTAHAPFGTAQLTLPDGRKLDFATARTEYYAHPAALPTVEFSSIKQDLARRDFSVNALALRVDESHFGELLDFFDGRSDLERRQLRVLHNLSFLEDPTRLLRAVRFEAQLGFRLAPESELYARFALEGGRFDGLGSERIKQELRRLLLRQDPLPVARRLLALGAWRILDADLHPDDETWRQMRLLRRVFHRAGLEDDPQRWLAYLAVLLRPFPLERAAQVLARLNLAGSDAKLVAEWLRQADRLLDAGEVLALAPADLVLALKTGPEVGVAFLATQAVSRPQRRVLARYWRDWRPVKLSVDGNDLKALGLPPGPRYARILREVLNARLAGSVRTATEERALLEQLARSGET